MNASFSDICVVFSTLKIYLSKSQKFFPIPFNRGLAWGQNCFQKTCHHTVPSHQKITIRLLPHHSPNDTWKWYFIFLSISTQSYISIKQIPKWHFKLPIAIDKFWSKFIGSHQSTKTIFESPHNSISIHRNNFSFKWKTPASVTFTVPVIFLW